MSKPPLETLITQRMRSPEAVCSKAARRAEFLAELPEIDDCLQKGWKIVDVWKTLRDHDRTSLSYSSFVEYVRRYSSTRRSASDQGRVEAAPPAAPAAPATPATPATPKLSADEAKQRMAESRKSAPDPGIPKFKFNNIPPPKEELI